MVGDVMQPFERPSLCGVALAEHEPAYPRLRHRQRTPRAEVPASLSPIAVDTETAENMVGGPRILMRLRKEFGLVPMEPDNTRKQVWSVRLLNLPFARMEKTLQRT